MEQRMGCIVEVSLQGRGTLCTDADDMRHCHQQGNCVLLPLYHQPTRIVC